MLRGCMLMGKVLYLGKTRGPADGWLLAGLQGTFADLSVLLEDCMQRPPEGVADGILLDLGMSSMQAGAS